MSKLQVNGHSMRIYSLDTEQTIKCRIAAKLKTLPLFLFFPPDNEFPDTTEITVIDLLNAVSTFDKTDAPSFFEQNGVKTLSQYAKQRLFEIWFVKNKSYREIVNDFPGNVPELNEFLATTFGKKGFSINDYLTDRKTRSIQEEMVSNVEKNREENQNTVERFKKFDENSGWVHTPFEKTDVHVKMQTDSELTVLEIFNRIRVSESIPFATVSNYFKILKDFDIPSNWLVQSEVKDDRKDEEDRKYRNRLKDGRNLKLYIRTNRQDTFITVLIYWENKKLIIEYYLKFEIHQITQQELEPRILDATGITESNIVNRIDLGVAGEFFFPNRFLNTYIFSDLCMNNEFFSSFLTVNEVNKATKEDLHLYMYFETSLIGNFIVTMSQKTAKSTNKLLGLNIDEPYVRVYCSGVKESKVLSFQNIFSKIMNEYDNRKSNDDDMNEQTYAIYEFYQHFIPSFNFQILVPSNKKSDAGDKLKYIEPAIFHVKGYSRRCSHPPIIVDIDDVSKYKNYIVFPRDKSADNTKQYPSDGVNQRVYVSGHKDFPYVGLFENNLSNADAYPYLPCSYLGNQENSDAYQAYYKNNYKQRPIKQGFIESNKLLKMGGTGMLPESIFKFLSILTSSTDIKELVRYGTFRSQRSFITSVFYATNYKNYRELPESKQVRLVNKLIKRIITTDLILTSRQSTYDIDLDTLKIQISNGYFDPNMMCQLMETVVEHNIYLFNTNRLVIPNHGNCYYINKPYSQSICILEHLGAESDNSEYPQCEAISLFGNLSFSGEISEKLINVFNVINQFYVLNRSIKPIDYQLPIGFSIVSQRLDSYGRTRRLDIANEGGNFSVYVSPIPPLNVKIDDEFKEDEINSKEVFLEQFKRNFLILPAIAETGSSELTIFNKHRKYARYITEYMFWLFSQFIENGKITDHSLLEFVNSRMIVQNDYTYGETIKEFSMNSTFIRDGKLIVNSEELKKRLIYVLKLQSIRNPKLLFDYKHNNYIVNYYIDISDFDEHPNQILIEGVENVENLIHNRVVDHKLFDTVVGINFNFPFFFKNKLISDDIYLAQHTATLEQAVDIHNTWVNSGYNKCSTDETPPVDNVLLYSFINENNITPYSINVSANPVKVLGYRLNGVPHYIVLLNV